MVAHVCKRIETTMHTWAVNEIWMKPRWFIAYIALFALYSFYVLVHQPGLRFAGALGAEHRIGAALYWNKSKTSRLQGGRELVTAEAFANHRDELQTPSVHLLVAHEWRLISNLVNLRSALSDSSRQS